MQNPPTPAEGNEAPIPTEIVSNANEPHLSDGTVALRRKAASRSLPWDLAAGELDLVSPPPPRDEDVPARKKRRLEEPLPTAIALSPHADVDDDDDDDDGDDGEKTDSVTDTKSNEREVGAIACWTSEEDAELTSAIANTHKTKGVKACNRDWVKIAAMVQGRTQKQCNNRWDSALDPSIALATGSKGKWTAFEDIKLKDAVQTHGGEDWVAIAALVLGRTRHQCYKRWNDVLNPIIGRASGSKGKWTAVEDSNLEDAVQTQGAKDWVAISLLVPGRTKKQCCQRWHVSLNPSIALATGSKGSRWAAMGDSKLKDAVQTHGGKNWSAIAALVLGRTKIQCRNRWHKTLNPSIALTAGCTGKWTEDEDSKLKDSVQMHGGKGWGAIAMLVPGRAESQCWHRWHYILDPSIGRASGSKGKWTAVEDGKLKDAVQTQGDNDWAAVADLVPGRTKSQCWHRWDAVLDPSIGRASGRKGKWTAVEDNQLKDAVQTHGDNGWVAISLLVPGRTKKQCNHRWQNVLDPSLDRAKGLTGKWTAVEDSKLRDAVQMHGGKDWVRIAALVPGRVQSQCRSRWQKVLRRSPKQK
jgi:hypothetical protein